MTGIPISEDRFLELVTSVTRERVHFECQPAYDVPEEAGDLDAWLDAMRNRRQPATPDQIGWWRAYLDDARAMHGRGVALTRIRVIDDPMTDYQRWGAWAAPWYAAAGEQLLYLTRDRAAGLGLPVIAHNAIPGSYDWDLLDGEQVIRTRFTPDGRPAGSTLITGPGIVARYRHWRDIAVRHAAAATPAAA